MLRVHSTGVATLAALMASEPRRPASPASSGRPTRARSDGSPGRVIALRPTGVSRTAKAAGSDARS